MALFDVFQAIPKGIIWLFETNPKRVNDPGSGTQPFEFRMVLFEFFRFSNGLEKNTVLFACLFIPKLVRRHYRYP